MKRNPNELTNYDRLILKEIQRTHGVISAREICANLKIPIEGRQIRYAVRHLRKLGYAIMSDRFGYWIEIRPMIINLTIDFLMTQIKSLSKTIRYLKRMQKNRTQLELIK